MTASPTHPPTIVIIGGGTAGAHAAAALRGEPVRTVIVEPSGHHPFLTRLAAVAAGVQPSSDASHPLDQLFPDADIVVDRATEIDDHSVTVAGGQRIVADAVVLTAGAEPAGAPIDGLDRARPLRTPTDAAALRELVRRGEPLVIVGGGPTGCQFAGAVKALDPDHEVTIIERSSSLLGAFHRSLGEHTARILDERGVRVVFDTDVDRIGDGAVEADGKVFDGEAVWTGGFESSMDHFELGPTTDGRLDTDAAGLVRSRHRVFAAGDCAAHRSREGEVFAMSAQIAAQTGRGCAKNALRLVTGRPVEALRPVDRGWVVDLGGGRGVAELMGVRLASPGLDRLAAVLHTLIDWRNLFQIGGVDAARRLRPHRQSGLEALDTGPVDLQALLP